MRIFIDDIREAPEGWHSCKTVAEAIRTIATMGGQIKEISLDFDDGTRNTFEPVAWFIKEYWTVRAGKNSPKIIIHTGNPGGAAKLADILQGFELSRQLSE